MSIQPHWCIISPYSLSIDRLQALLLHTFPMHEASLALLHVILLLTHLYICNCLHHPGFVRTHINTRSGLVTTHFLTFPLLSRCSGVTIISLPRSLSLRN